MLNNAITGVGEGFERRKQQGVINDREAQRLAMEREMRNTQTQREDRMETEGNRRFNLATDRETRLDQDSKARGDREEKRLNLAMQPHIQADVTDPVSGTSMTLTGTPEQLAAMQSEYAKKFPGKQLQVSNKKAFAAQFNVGGAQFSFQDPEAANKFATDMKTTHGIDVFKTDSATPEVFTSPGGQEFVKRGKQFLKGAPAPTGSTTTSVKETPPGPFARVGTPITKTTNVTTRVSSAVPRGTTGAEPGGQRVKVKGPNGESGTVDASDTLPEGWSKIE